MAIDESAKIAQKRPISMFAIDFHLWNGAIYLALLLEEEVSRDLKINNPEEMAAWELYDCSEGIPMWNQAIDFAKELQTLDRSYHTEGFKLISSTIKALEEHIRSTYSIGKNFRISVAHPDTLEEFFISALRSS